jgi:hypothetical protein
MQITSDTAVTGYRLVLPPGWKKIPLRTKRGANQAFAELAESAFGALPKNLPRDKVTAFRIRLEQQTAAMIAEARGNGGVDLYIPVELMHSIPVAASFVVSQGAVGSPDQTDPAAVLAYLASESDTATLVTVADSMAMRTERTAGPEAAPDAPAGSRRVDYVISVPGCGDHWVIISFATLTWDGLDDTFAKLIMELFDAIVSTFRWTKAAS